MDDRVGTTARLIRSAYTTGAVAPLRDFLEPTDAEGAYAIQAHNTEFWKEQGRQIVGRKIGLTAKSVQAQLGVDQPDYGVLFDDMRIRNGGILANAKVLQPKAEAEIAVVLNSDITDPHANYETMLAAVDYVSPAIEIVDSRIADWKITFADTVADNGSSAFFVLGDQKHPVDEVDLYSCGMVMEVNGEPASVGAGAACLGHPLKAAAWLARAMVVVGSPLKKGDILLTGALGPMITPTHGDHIKAIIGGIGECGFTFESKSE